MAAAQGYIGRNPADSSTVIARQSFSPTGIQTDFTFAAGYEIGYVDLYLNGARLVEGQDFSATDGSTVGLTTNAVNGDVLEVVAFKAFNATSVSAAAGNFTVGGTLDVTGATSIGGNTTVGTGITLDTNGNVNVSGVLTAGSFYGDGTNLTGVGGGSVISGITIREEGSVVGTAGTVVNVNFVGPDVTATAQAGFSTITIAAGGKFINFTDGGSTGITTTAKTKIDDDFNVTGVGTFASRVSIGDSIFHVGDDNTAFGFPAADIFTVYTAGSERIRVSSDGSVGIGTTNPQARLSFGRYFPANGQTIHTFHDGNTRSGLGIVAGVHRMFTDSESTLSLGHVELSDGSTYTESLRVNPRGQLLVGITTTTGVVDAAAVFGSERTANDYAKIYLVSDTSNPSDDTALGFIGFSQDTLTNIPNAFIEVSADGDHASNDYPTKFHFFTTPDSSSTATEKLRITAAGNISIPNDSGKFVAGAGNDLDIYHDGSNSYIRNNTGQLLIRGNEIRVQSYLGSDTNFILSGVGTATQWDATSDVALKENIEIIDEPISKLSELKGVTFDWKKGGHSVGVIAQDVEKVLPTAVGGSKDQKTVNYNAIIGLLVESVKDQQKQIEELKSLLDK